MFQGGESPREWSEGAALFVAATRSGLLSQNGYGLSCTPPRPTLMGGSADTQVTLWNYFFMITMALAKYKLHTGRDTNSRPSGSEYAQSPVVAWRS